MTADIFAACLADAGFPAAAERGIGLEQRHSGFLHGRKRMQAGSVIVAQPARLVIDEIGKGRNFCAAGADLVDLLLILHHGETHAGMVEHIGHFVCDRVGIDGHGHRAERLRRREGPVEARPVGADDGDGSPRRSPSAWRPIASARTSSSCSAQVQLCQMPKSLWRMAGRSPSLSALRRRYFGNVSMSPADAVAIMFLLLPAPHGSRMLQP